MSPALPSPRTAVLAAALAATSPAFADTFRVGAAGDPACSHTTLFAAVIAASGNGPGLDTIRIANTQAYTGVVLAVSGHSLRIEGGYASCGAASASGRTTLTGGTGTSTAISTSGTGPHTLELVNLDIANSPTGGSASRLGGGLRITGNYQVTLRNTQVRNNTAARGGGIYIDAVTGTRLTLALPASSISDNDATIAGGGIYCTGPALIDWQAGAGAVFGNAATSNGTDPDESGSGGGAALFNGCSMTQHGGPGLTHLFGNSAVQYGGGYYLRNQARLHLVGSGQHPARISENITTLASGGTPGAGGGIAIRDPAGSGTTSEALVENSAIEGNRSWQGSGVALLGGGRFLMRRTLAGSACHDARYCSSLSFNGVPGASQSARAGALWAQQGARVEITGTYIEGNGALVGSALWTNGSAVTTLDSVVLTGNHGATTLIDARDIGGGGSITLAWSTVTGNSYTGSAAGQRILGANQAPSAQSVRIYGSLLGEPLINGIQSPQLLSDCVLRDPAMAALGAGPNITRQGTLAAPYGLAAPASGDFHLASGSATPVDWCDISVGPRLGRDIAGNLGIVDAVATNLWGIRDLGAHEFQDTDLIFAHGFQLPTP
jgi:hypothetical protein